MTVKTADGEEWGDRIFWLKTSRFFEIRHGGGGDFIWWVDHVISNEVALRFNGMVEDDAGGGKRKPEPDKYLTLEKYLKFSRGWDNNLKGRFFVQTVLEEMTPPEFWFDTGKKVTMTTNPDGSYAFTEEE